MLKKRSKPVDFAESAQGMIRSYGAEAETEAMIRATRFEQANDRLGSETWKAIAQAIRQAVKDKPATAP